MEKKKILLCAYSLDTGGAEKMLYETVMNIKNVEFEILLVKPGGEFYNKIPSNIKIHNLVTKNNIKIINRIKIIYLLISLRLFLKKFDDKYDAIIAYDCFFGALMADKIVSTKKIHWIHTNINDALSSRKNLLLNVMISKKTLEKIYDKANKIFCVCKKSKNDFENTFMNINDKNKVRIVYNPINIERVKKMAEEEIDSENEDFIVCCGRLSYAKGQKNLIQELKKLKDRNVEFKCYLIGEGKDRSELESMIEKMNLSNDIKLLGHKDNPYKYIKKSKLVVIPSKYESYCMVAAEAIVLNKAIISTNTLGVSEVLLSGKIGQICEEEKFNEYIEKALQNNSYFEKLVKSTEISSHIVSDFTIIQKEILN